MKISHRNRQSPNHTPEHQSGTARIVPVFVILFVIALGALAAPRSSQQDRDHDRDRDFDRFIFVSHEEVMVADLHPMHFVKKARSLSASTYRRENSSTPRGSTARALIAMAASATSAR
jgi:hypothetical protein